MKKWLLLSVGFAAALSGVAANEPIYTLGIPRVPILRAVTNLVEADETYAAWAVSNASVAFAASAYFETNGVIEAAFVGFPFERNKPQYYLGDKITPPGGAVDWDATYAWYCGDSAAQASFLFDLEHKAVYVTAGGILTFTWTMADGSTNEVTMVTTAVSSGRPKNIFWTDTKYGGQTIDLSGKFVRLYGPSNIVTKTMGRESTGVTIGGEESWRDVVVSGLYIDDTGGRRTLYAAGELSGQVVLAYYDSATYEHLVAVQVIEVSRPRTERLSGTVGSTLEPSGRGYTGDGLEARPTTLEAYDNFGPFVYQHEGRTPYSPKHKKVFALRPTDEKTRNQTQIYWMETDEQGVSWPFEVDEYIVSWPKDIQPFVRSGDRDAPGQPMTFPAELGVELMDYQEGPDGFVHQHATEPANGEFSSYDEGRALLKFTANDDIWFLPVESVFRTNAGWYTLEPTTSRVGDELFCRGGSVSGVAGGRTLVVDSSISGTIYEPASDPVWNPQLYSATGTGWNGLKSAVFPVTASMDASRTSAVEIWWKSGYFEDGMPGAVTIPALPQRYEIRWPRSGEMPEIATVSQLGSKGLSRFQSGSALVFDGSNATVRLPNRRLFSATGGAVSLWTRPYDATARLEDCRLLTLGTDTNGASRVKIELEADEVGEKMKAVVTLGMAELSVPLPSLDDWSCLLLSWRSDGTCSLSAADAQGVTSGESGMLDSGTVAELGEVLSGNTLGADGYGCKAASMRELDRVATWNEPLDIDELFARASETIGGREDGLTLGIEFEGDGEVLDEGRGDVRHARDLAWDISVEARQCLRDEPGAPRVGRVTVDSDVTPVLYRQPDPEQVGFNPNEEHAFVQAAGTDYTVWALRGDLNYAGGKEKAYSPPAALVQYAKDGYVKMQYFDVVVTNAFYSTFGDSCEAGRSLAGPQPLTLRDNPWPGEIYWRFNMNDTVKAVPFRDRKKQLWALSEGGFDIFMYYVRTSDFDWPDADDVPAVGASVPWLAYFGGGTGETPHPWHWTITWPENVPEMCIGQTLTAATEGLPEVWNATSMAVVYPTDNGLNVWADDTVVLSDPTIARSVELGFRASQLAEIGLLTGPGEKMHESKGYWYFRDLAPSLSSRLYVDPSNDTLVMKGVKEDNPGGVELLHVNVLTKELADSVLALAVKDAGGVYAKFSVALNALVAMGRKLPTSVRRKLNDPRFGDAYEIVASYEPRDHYALTAMGRTGYVVLVENDATNDWCNAGNPINLRLFKVIPKYYTGRVVTREDPLNLLSQVLGIHYSEPFAGDASGYVFDWRQARPGSNGTVPSDYDNWSGKFSAEEGRGKTEFTVGSQGDTLANMVNTYWTCRYRAADTTSPAYATMGEEWSDWITPPALAEGWVQRVLNNITPFTQRMTDLYENPAETAVSMIQQAGKPFEGDVALNQENLTSVGLIELYRTILDKAESMSLLIGVKDRDANKQLMLAVERLADLYGVLGDEAYADAANPTIGFGSNFGDIEPGLTLDYGAASSSLFCFDNQVPTLLDEELALLRGRSCVNAPGNTVGPYYNRLVWNFTKGITAGEVAYAVNYNMSDSRTSTLDASTAAKLYPQGHGDAYGHYLSALQGWYRLLRNPNFDWGEPAMGEMNVADNVVNVDYYDEAKFADTAAAVARTAKRTVELTALKHWRDRGADSVGGGYLDADAANAFGYGEWASRGAFGALCNWAVANSLLPEKEEADGSGEKYADQGLLHIDRGTVGGIGEISSAAEAIQQMVDRMDAGMNPLGFDENAIPFDLTPIGDAKDATHFEQVRARAAKAFANAKAVLDRAQEYGNRIRLLEEARAGLVDDLDTYEDDTCAELIALYGRPYSDDVGPGKTYPQDYYGPDLYHYMWVNNLSDFGLTSVEDTLVATTVVYKVADYQEDGTIKDFVENSVVEHTNGVGVLTYSLSANGVVVKGEEIRGERPASGELQQAYADFLSAYAGVESALGGYTLSLEKLQNEQNIAWAKWNALKNRVAVLGKVYWDDNKLEHQIERLENLKIAQATLENTIDFNSVFTYGGGKTDETGCVGLSTTIGTDFAKAHLGVIAGIVAGVLYAAKDLIDCELANAEEQISKLQRDVAEADAQYSVAVDTAGLWDDVIAACDAHLSAIGTLKERWRAMNEAQLQVSALVQKGRGIQEGLELKRQQAVNNIAKMRYNDMFFRKLRNDALAQYDAAFDLAKKYAFLAAKAYGYETGSMPDDLIRTILAARSLGETDGSGSPIVSGNGDAGLAGALAKMDANWDNLKTQLGINNPQPYATWFSLRHELFRILKGDLGDAAWRTELTKHWTDDIRTNPDFLRHCQPFASQFGLAEKEPGLVFTFETTVDFALNLFGKPLAYDDSQFDSSWYATKITAAGVWFENYNEKAAGYNGQESAFAATPNVYLVPIGTDRMRVPGTDGSEIAGFDVVDQTVPVPYPVTATELAEANWLPSYLQGEYAGVDKETRIRRHPSFRAYYGPAGTKPTDAQLDAVRLTGRSVWNTKWMLVIPAGTLNSNRTKALNAFIGGLDVNGDGQADIKPVSDIRIGFKTYSLGGK